MCLSRSLPWWEGGHVRVNTWCLARKLKGEEGLILLPSGGLPPPHAALQVPASDPHQGTLQLALTLAGKQWSDSSVQRSQLQALALWSTRISKPVFRTAENSDVEALCGIPPSFRPRSILDWIHSFLEMEMPKDNKSVLLESTKGTQKCALMPTCHWN